MVTVQAMVTRMILNKFLSTAIALLVVFLCLGFTGCAKASSSVDGSLAEQIALDAAGLSRSNVRDLQTNSSNFGFSVMFSDHSGKYIIGVDPEGKVDSYKFIKDEQPAEVETETNMDNTVETKKAEPTAPDTTAVRLPEGSLPKSELISRTAAFLGITQYDESDFVLESTASDQVTMTVRLDDGRVLFTVLNPYSGDVLSSGNR